MVNPVLEYPISGYHDQGRLTFTCGPKMKSLKGNTDKVIDVRAKRSVGAKRRLWAMAMILCLFAASVILLGYFQFWKPYQYKQTAEFVMRDVLKDSWWRRDPIAGSGKVPIAELQPIDQSLELANILANNTGIDINNEQRIELSNRLFQYSISFGNPFARIDYGIALLEGYFGLRDKLAADYQFDQARMELQEPAQKGKPREALAYSILLTAGYGGPKDHDAAKSLVRKVLGELNVNDLEKFMLAPGSRHDLVFDVFSRMQEEGYILDENDIEWACSDKFIDQRSRASQAMLDHEKESFKSLEIERFYWSRYMDVVYTERKCVKELNEKNVFPPSQSTGERENITSKPKSNTPPEKVQRAEVVKPQVEIKSLPKAPLARDAEKQAETGYLNGSPSPVAAGLSTFTVDNKSGSADALARIYLNGDKPAVRQIYIKTGEKFTANELAPGRYVLRYRFIGSSDTYEADKVFALEEIRDSEGITYSKVSVTLFTVTNGNMKVKRVPDEKF